MESLFILGAMIGAVVLAGTAICAQRLKRAGLGLAGATILVATPSELLGTQEIAVVILGTGLILSIVLIILDMRLLEDVPITSGRLGAEVVGERAD